MPPPGRTSARRAGAGSRTGIEVPSAVSVSVRVRPLFASERSRGASEVFLKEGPRSLAEKTADGSLRSWQFMDHVFGPHDSTAAVFEAVVVPILNRVLDGFNASVFAYGQVPQYVCKGWMVQ